MNDDELKQRLSAYFDGESFSGEEPSLFHKRCSSQEKAEQLKSWQAYSVIRAGMKDELSECCSSDFSVQVANAIQNEPSILIPRQRHFAINKKFSGWALAASVATLMIVGTQWFSFLQSDSDTSLVAQEDLTRDVDTGKITVDHATFEEQLQFARMEKLFNEYARASALRGQNIGQVQTVGQDVNNTYRLSPQAFRNLMTELEALKREAGKKAEEELNRERQAQE